MSKQHSCQHIQASKTLDELISFLEGNENAIKHPQVPTTKTFQITFILNSHRDHVGTWEYKLDTSKNLQKEHRKLLLKAKKKLHRYRNPTRMFIPHNNRITELTTTNLYQTLLTTEETNLTIFVSMGENYRNHSSYQEALAVFWGKFEERSQTTDDICQTIVDFLPKDVSPINPVVQQFIRKELTKALGWKRGNEEFSRAKYTEHNRIMYEALKEEFLVNRHTIHPPFGLTARKINNDVLVSNARKQVDQIFDEMLSDQPELDLDTNLRLYIHTPYFTRQEAGSDPWPLFQWGDPRVSDVCECIKIAKRELEIGLGFRIPFEDKLINIIVRQYRGGDVLGFHRDRDEFDEIVCGIVLRNDRPEDASLLFYEDKNQPYMGEEVPGYCWAIKDVARWEWQHALYVPVDDKRRNGLKKPVRTSVTFRWFRDESLVPEYIPM